MKLYDRVDANFKRVNLYIQTGRLPVDEIQSELRKFADLYWDVYESERGTYASKIAFENAITLLEGIAPDEMISKINSSFDEEYAYAMAVTLGKKYIATKKGLKQLLPISIL